MQFPKKTKEGLGSSEIEITDSCERPCGFWNSIGGPLVEKLVTLKAELSSQTDFLDF